MELMCTEQVGWYRQVIVLFNRDSPCLQTHVGKSHIILTDCKTSLLIYPLFADVKYTTHRDVALLSVDQNVTGKSLSCCQALCAKSQSCAAFQKQGERCLMSNKALLLNSNSSDASGNPSVGVEGPMAEIVYNISTVYAPGEYFKWTQSLAWAGLGQVLWWANIWSNWQKNVWSSCTCLKIQATNYCCGPPYNLDSFDIDKLRSCLT